MWPCSVVTTPNPSSFFLFLPSSSTNNNNYKPSFFHLHTPRRCFRLSPQSTTSPDFNGWAHLDTPARSTTAHKPFSSFAPFAAATASVALLLAAFSLSSRNNNGFNIQFTTPLQRMWSSITTTRGDRGKAVVEEEEFDESTAEEAVLQTGKQPQWTRLFVVNIVFILHSCYLRVGPLRLGGIVPQLLLTSGV